MNFTREPIIETIITPREGCKLVVRSSKGGSQEDYFVDAVEVVSFGHSFFFRSMERPKSFLVPVSDYEILELKETRMVLKNASADRSIKISGGREAHPPRQQQPQREEEEPESETAAPQPQVQQQDRGVDKKRSRRSRRRRGGGNMPMEEREEVPAAATMEHQAQMEPEESGEEIEEAAPSFISKLFPPPPTLIKETLGRYKTGPEGIIVESDQEIAQRGVFEHTFSESEMPKETSESSFLTNEDVPPNEDEESEE